MKKYLYCFLLMCFFNNISAQHIEYFQRGCNNEIFVDFEVSTEIYTSKLEGECLNLLFGLDSEKNDLRNKNVCFIMGPKHNYFSSKEVFWNEFKNDIINNLYQFSQLFYLDEYYRVLYNCDAIIVYGHKKYFSNKEIVKMLEKYNCKIK